MKLIVLNKRGEPTDIVQIMYCSLCPDLTNSDPSSVSYQICDVCGELGYLFTDDKRVLVNFMTRDTLIVIGCLDWEVD